MVIADEAKGKHITLDFDMFSKVNVEKLRQAFLDWDMPNT